MIDIREHIEPSHNDNRTLALNRAIKAATLSADSIYFPPGQYHFETPPDPIGVGITIKGDSGKTSSKLGTCLIIDYEESDNDGGFLTWDGKDSRTYKGAGGGLKDLTIMRLNDTSGGTAIKLICSDDKFYRVGWWTLSNVAVWAGGKSSFDRVMLVDGTAVGGDKLGAEGLRVVEIFGLMASSAKMSTVELRNAVHFRWFGGDVQAGPTVDPHKFPVGILIKGKSVDITILGVAIYGTLVLEEVEQLVYSGTCKWLKLGTKEELLKRKMTGTDKGKVKRCIIDAVGCDKVEDYTLPRDEIILRRV